MSRLSHAAPCPVGEAERSAVPMSGNQSRKQFARQRGARIRWPFIEPLREPAIIGLLVASITAAFLAMMLLVVDPSGRGAWNPLASAERIPPNPVWNVSASSDGSRIHCLGHGAITVWDRATGRELHSIRFPGGVVLASALSPCGNRLLLGQARERLIELEIDGGARDPSSPPAVPLPAELLVGSSKDGPGASCGEVCYSPNGELAAASTSGGDIVVWQTATGRKLGERTLHADEFGRLRFSPDGKRLLSIGRECVQVWDLADGSLLAAVPAESDSIHFDAAFAGGGRQILAGGSRGHLRLIDIATGELLWRVRPHAVMLQSVAVSPDGRLAASGGDERQIRVWNLQTRREIAVCIGHTGIVRTLTFVGAGRMLLSGSLDGTVRLWDASSGRELQRYR